MKTDKPERLTYTSPTFGTQFERRSNTVRPDEVEAEPRKVKVKRWLKLSLLAILGLIIIGGLIIGWDFYIVAARLTNDHNPFSLIANIWPQSMAETNGRVNILLAGYSLDDPNHAGASLTDSIMIVSVNPKSKTATLISVPRDLWVSIPGYGYNKINAAYEDGQAENFNQAGYFPGGMGLLEQVVSQKFGIGFNYYALIDYAAFKDAVNAVGGIKINIQSTDPRGLYDAYTHLQLANGWVTLNGQQALNLARARGDNSAGDVSYGFAGSDFERTQHQQQMLIALKDKAGHISSLIDPFTVIKLVNAVGNNVKTDFTIGQMETLYHDTKGVSTQNIKQITLNNYMGQDLLTNYYAYGQSSLIPATGINDYSQIQSVVKQALYGQ